jgi:hypothetical protein
MKPTKALSSLKPYLMIVIVLILAIQPTAAVSAQQGIRQAAPTTQSNLAGPQKISAAASGCQWTYYPIQGGKLQPEQLLYNDPDNTPLVNLSLGNPFKGKTTHLASNGSTDFDGDNKTDVFRTIPRLDGNLQWQYSSGGTAPWANLAYASNTLPVSQLQFGEFNSDLKSDVFANFYNSPTVNYQWLYSPGGTNSFVLLNSTNFPPARLALGDFNGDGVTDVFTATQNAGTYDWAYSPGGSGASVGLAHSAGDPALLRFGDFNGDGTTDVFSATQLADGSTQWLYSSGGAASFTNLNPSTVPYSELNFGDYNGDGKTDVLAALPAGDGSLEVVYWSGGLGSAISLGRIPAPAPALRVGDFNGDGISDLMAVHCGMNGPLAFSPVQTLATSGYSTFYKSLSANVNGDRFPDLIFVSTCQNPSAFGNCATHHLQVGSALGTPFNTYTLTAPQQLGANSLDFTYYKAMTGDFNGDGKSDLALIYPGATTLTIYVALSNGDGTFNLGSAQTFGGETWGNFNPTVGDYNGDGKADLAFSTVCAISSGSCSVGDNNSVYVASSGSGGTFTMSARQDIGPIGWTDYYTYVGDFNGDGKTDLLFNSTCQKTNFTDSTCTISDANYVYTALSNGNGSFALSARQTYGASGWADYPNSIDLLGDVNGDGRTDVVWSSSYQSATKTYNNLAVVGFANPDGTFQLGAGQNFGSAWSGRLSLADLNHDGKADLVWNNAPYGDTDVDTYAAAVSNGNGTFTTPGQGSVYTGPGYFSLPDIDAYGKVPSSLTIVSTRQDSISNALFVVNSVLPGSVTFLPLLKK